MFALANSLIKMANPFFCIRADRSGAASSHHADTACDDAFRLEKSDAGYHSTI